MSITTTLKSTLWAALPLLCLSACDGGAGKQSVASEPSPNSASAATASPKKSNMPNYIVVSQYSYPPFATRDEKGNLVGMDMDLLNAIAEKQGFTLTFLPHNMTGLLETLNTGHADIVATGVNITPERMQKYEFSKPYLEGHWAALLDRKKLNVSSWEELRNKKIAAQESSLSETQLVATQITNQMVRVKTVYLGLNEIQTGGAVAVYDVDSVLNTYFKDNPDYYTVMDEKSGTIPFGFVMKKGNTELKAKLDAGIDALQADGTYQKILDKWYPKGATPIAAASSTSDSSVATASSVATSAVAVASDVVPVKAASVEATSAAK